ncbi:MAG: YfiR family protein [Rudaea sp.]
MALLAAGLPCRRWLCLLLVLLLPLGPEVSARAQVPDYQIKAVFLFNFTEFVEWPSDAFADAQKPLVIGVLGDDPFDGYLDATIRGEKVGNRPLLVRRYRRVEDVDACQVLFISRSEIDRLEPIIDSLKHRSILTVSDVDGFTQHGGMIRFVTRRNHVRLQINLAATQAAGLTLSSKLLQVAEVMPRDRGRQ